MVASSCNLPATSNFAVVAKSYKEVVGGCVDLLTPMSMFEIGNQSQESIRGNMIMISQTGTGSEKTGICSVETETVSGET